MISAVGISSFKPLRLNSSSSLSSSIWSRVRAPPLSFFYFNFQDVNFSPVKCQTVKELPVNIQQPQMSSSVLREPCGNLNLHWRSVSRRKNPEVALIFCPEIHVCALKSFIQALLLSLLSWDEFQVALYPNVCARPFEGVVGVSRFLHVSSLCPVWSTSSSSHEFIVCVCVCVRLIGYYTSLRLHLHAGPLRAVCQHCVSLRSWATTALGFTAPLFKFEFLTA